VPHVPALNSATVFDALARDYDADGEHAGLARRLVRLVACHLGSGVRPGHVLDLATGTGAAAFAALTLEPQLVTAIDLSPAMLARAREAARTDDPEGRIRWHCAAVHPLPAIALEPAPQLIICASALHFLERAALGTWWHALTPGGLVAVTLPAESAFNPGPAFRALLPREANRIPLPASTGDVERLARTTGFEPVEAVLDARHALLVARKPR